MGLASNEVIMYRFTDLVQACLSRVPEIFPWDLADKLDTDESVLILDVREKAEFDRAHIEGSMHVPRGVLESACEYGYEETVPELVRARDREIVVVCRSGNRSVLAADTMQRMGYNDVKSLKTGLRGWNDDEQPLVDSKGSSVAVEQMDDYFAPKVSVEQLGK
jgi:rhodanese-related sulfurtransferase